MGGSHISGEMLVSSLHAVEAYIRHIRAEFYSMLFYFFIVICDCYLELCIHLYAYELLHSYHPAKGSNYISLKKMDFLYEFVGHLGF